jgi:hypothetical protein
MKVVLLARPENRSPRVLAESLRVQLEENETSADIIYDVGLLRRLVAWQHKKQSTRFHFWIRQKLRHALTDRVLIRRLRRYDAVIVCECIPNAFWNHEFNVEKLRELIQKPILLYEVFYLGNAPSQLAHLALHAHPQIGRYDWHLSVSRVTEVTRPATGPWSYVGLDLAYLRLQPPKRERFVALLDFAQPGYEEYRSNQLRILRELEIDTICLDGNYTIGEIRRIYSRASIFFLQTPEAFGLPIAECFSVGTKVYLPNAHWAMSWRPPTTDNETTSADLSPPFVTYSSWDDLRTKLRDERDSYDLTRSPMNVLKEFISNFPDFYYGRPRAISDVIERVQSKDFRTTTQT